MGCRAFILKKKEKKKKKKKKMEKIAVWPISVYTDRYGSLWVFLGREALEDHRQLPKKANKYSIGVVVSFLYVW